MVDEETNKDVYYIFSVKRRNKLYKRKLNIRFNLTVLRISGIEHVFTSSLPFTPPLSDPSCAPHFLLNLRLLL